MPVEILGQVYEQFLGKVIRLTAGHQAMVEEKPEVRKAGGVYYTPTYIVDYIVEHTVGQLLEGKTPTAKRGRRSASSTRPAAPARSCIGAYDFLLDWYRDRYVGRRPGRSTEGSSSTRTAAAAAWRLTTTSASASCCDNIYGVDIDPQAVEVTKLSLCSRCWKGETGRRQRADHVPRARCCPTWPRNIKCGNSLIGPDFYDRQQALSSTRRSGSDQRVRLDGGVPGDHEGGRVRRGDREPALHRLPRLHGR